MKKNPNLKRICALILACSMAATMLVVNTSINNSKESAACFKGDTVINILHTNDIHADVENLSYVAEYKDRTKNAILVDAGDATQGQPLATYTKGEAIIEIMNAADYDVSAVGNHEFDYGTEQFLKNIKKADFPFLAANVRNYDDGSTFIESKKNNGAYTIIKKAGKRIGFFGITTTEAAYKTNPANVIGIEFEGEIERAQETADKLNAKGCDFVVGVIHVGNDETSKPTSIEMAEELEGVDLLIDGHSHTELQYTAANGTRLVQTGTQLSTLGKVTVTFSNDDTYINTQLLSEEKYQMYGKDNNVSKLYDKVTKKLEPILNQVIGKTDTDLIANEIDESGESVRIVRNRETSMGDLAADSMLWGANEFLASTDYKELPVFAMTNGGGVRANIEAGEITIGDVFSVLPFGNNLSIKVVNPSVIYEMLEFSISGLSLDENNNVTGLVGSYPQVSGIRFEMDLTKEAYSEESKGNRVVAVYLKNEDGTETLLNREDTDTEIAFASNNFLIAGGDGYTMLTNLKHIAEGNVLDEILADYVTILTEEAGGCFTYVMDGNRSVEINGKK
ncbi:MAG: bifunctional metallophosphatase/5'-nucleotidase [Lachnospiraceae bacterium]|nr:bifunctional metallophosphatase/5'-nucleotidase [Lachnospiraceae bacterium]